MEEKDRIEIDGSQGEGGGQLLRTSLALAAITGKAVSAKNIRASRPKPGLMPQHLAAVETIASLCNAEVHGAKIGSTSLSFKPGKVSKSSLTVNIGTAGSISLLLSQVLPLSLLHETKLHVFGGTNVPFSPPIEFLQFALFPMLKQMGARFEAKTNNRGYFPKGRGSACFSSRPASLPLKPICLSEFGELSHIEIFSHCASLPKSVARNQASAAREQLPGIEFEEHIECREKSATIGSGITLLAHTTTGAILAGSALGRKGVPASTIGKDAAGNLLQELSQKKPCDSHLADQLIPFMALAKGKSEVHATRLTKHCVTNIGIVEKFLPVKFVVDGEEGKPATISVEGAAFVKLVP